MEEVHKNAIDNVFQAMDRKVVSHKKLKEALVLGMISQEHVYVEGPPGAAKTLISETISKSTDLEFFYQLHRDTRLGQEIIGDASIVREKDARWGRDYQTDYCTGWYTHSGGMCIGRYHEMSR